MLRDVRIFFANPRARLAVLLEAERRLHQRPGIAVEHVDLDPLTVAFGEFRLRVEQIHRARRAFHEQPDDRFGFRPDNAEGAAPSDRARAGIRLPAPASRCFATDPPKPAGQIPRRPFSKIRGGWRTSRNVRNVEAVFIACFVNPRK